MWCPKHRDRYHQVMDPPWPAPTGWISSGHPDRSIEALHYRREQAIQERRDYVKWLRSVCETRTECEGLTHGDG